LNLEFTLAEDTSWATAGHAIATGQLQLTTPQSLICLQQLTISPKSAPLTASLLSPGLLSINSPAGSRWDFDLTLGTLRNWTRPSGSSVFSESLRFDLFRALTDNDRGCDFGRNWIDRRLHQAKDHPKQASWSFAADGGTIDITVRSRIAPPVLNWALETKTIYQFSSSTDTLAIKAHAKPSGELLPCAWARFGLVSAVKGIDSVKWFGRGPGESYRDKKLSQSVGTWESSLDGLWTDYEFPQENGNRTDVRWVECRDKHGEKLLRARWGEFEGASFSARRYGDLEIEKAQHPFELRGKERRGDAVLHLDWYHHGLGTGSCGPETLEEYTLDAGREMEVEVVLD